MDRGFAYYLTWRGEGQDMRSPISSAERRQDLVTLIAALREIWQFGWKVQQAPAQASRFATAGEVRRHEV